MEQCGRTLLNLKACIALPQTYYIYIYIQGCWYVLSSTRKETSYCFFQNGVNFLLRLALQEKKNLMTARVSMLLNRARPWLASELASFLVGLRTYQHPCIYICVCMCVCAGWRAAWLLAVRRVCLDRSGLSLWVPSPCLRHGTVYGTLNYC